MALTDTTYLISEWVLVGVATLFVGARFAVRVWRRTWSFWLSDICLMLTLLTFVAFACGDLANFIQGRTEFGTQYSASYAEWIYAAQVLFDAIFYLPRFSLLTFYYELFPISEPTMRTWLYVVMVYTAAGLVSALTVDIFWCGLDIPQNWSPEPTCGIALSMEPLFINWSIGIASEIFILMLPLPLIWKMKKLNRREKFALTGMLLFGVITITVSTSRFTMMSLNYWNHETYLMSAAEITTQIIVVAAPSLRPLLGIVKLPSVCRSRGNSATRGRYIGSRYISSSKYGPNTSGSLQEPGMAFLGGNQGRNWGLPDLEFGSSWRIEIGRLEDNPTGQIQEPWEAIKLPRIID